MAERYRDAGAGRAARRRRLTGDAGTDATAATRATVTRATAATRAATRPRADPPSRGARPSALALAALVLLALAPAVSHAQSGRRQPGATPTPTPQRPRRAPAQDPPPGQPSTPDAPSTTTRATPTPAAGQSSAAPIIDDDEVYRVESNLVPVSANVSDATGRAVVDLKVEDFELRVDGQPKPISDISFSETPVRLALLFDNSSSIRPTRELEKHAAAGFFRKVLRPVDQGAVFSIATYPTLDQQLTSDTARLARTIESYGDMENSTALFDTIVMAAEYLRPMPGRKVIVIVSDGVETTSRLTDFGEVVRRVLAADCQVFVIQTGLSDNANLRDLMAERRMQDLTASTGGAVYTPKRAADLEDAFVHISNDLRQQYVLSYYPSDDGRDGRFRAISLRVKTRPNMRVRARRGYYPRRRADDLSSSPVPQTFVGTDPAAQDLAAGVAQASAPSPTPDAPPSGPQQPAPSEAASNAHAAAPPRASGPVHGSKNLDLEESGASPRAEARPASDARPAVRLGNFKPPPETATEAAEVASARPGPERAPPVPVPDSRRDDAAPPLNADADRHTPQPRPDSTTQTQPETTNPLSATRARTAVVPRDDRPPQPAQLNEPTRPAGPEQSDAGRPQSDGSNAERARVEEPKANESKTEESKADGSKAEESKANESKTGGSKTEESKADAAGGAEKSDAAARRVPISGGVLNGRAVSLPRPAYPEHARRMRVAGTVAVEVVIDESGKVVSARAASGPVALRDAAASAARQARFSPTLVSGLPVQVKGIINYTFSL